jgi:monofunctional biosynthetic peptidoglycan transglycosylase
MKKLISKISQIVRWAMAIFFGTTILTVVVLKFFPVYYTPLMFIRLFQLDEVKLSHEWVSIDEISPSMPLAVMGSEDANFQEHWGFDFKAIQDAAEHNKKHPEKNKHGASTISQQTAKNVFLWPGRSWIRKGLEAYFTILIEVFWSKERIMEVYLNSIEMGPGIYGVQAVAHEHFGCDAKDLTANQCALIAATLPNPRRFSSKTPNKYMKKRQRWILDNMRYVKPLEK